LNTQNRPASSELNRCICQSTTYRSVASWLAALACFSVRIPNTIVAINVKPAKTAATIVHTSVCVSTSASVCVFNERMWQGAPDWLRTDWSVLVEHKRLAPVGATT
jgi:hypothetical protein